MYSVRYRNMAKIEAEIVNATMDTPTKAGRLKSDEVEHRIACPLLVDEEDDHEDDRAGEEADGRRRSTSPVVAAHEREDQEEEAGGERDEPDPVDARVCGSFDCAIRVKVTKMATTPIGTLTKKIHRQPMALVMAPPTNGPTATAPPMTPP